METITESRARQIAYGGLSIKGLNAFYADPENVKGFEEWLKEQKERRTQ